MNLLKIFKDAYNAVKNPEREFFERIFLILTFVSEITVLIAFIGDIVTKENPLEILLLALVLVFVPTSVLLGLHHNRLMTVIRIIMVAIVVVVLPSLFFFGGGVEGGGFLWIIFAFMYVGLVLSGRWRNIMFMIIFLLTLACYLVAYYHPELVYDHSREMFYIDSFVSLVLVGILCFAMTWSQGLLFSEENERAKKEAERAEELTRSQNRFFSSMSHEIRTPINSILGLNELILRDETASDDIIRDATGIQGSGKMLLSLINDILDFSKIEAGSMDIVPVDYRIGDMLSEIVNMMWLRAHDKGLGFEVSVDPGVPVVLYGDEVRIKQLIINLLNNAVKYTKEGKVELRVESRDIDQDNVELIVSVTDTGMGIKKEDLPFLFDAFKRVDEGQNRHIEGTGLGLSIVKQLIELMDGKITVNSIYGEGSEFTFVIRQKVSDHSSVGELNIHNQQAIKRNAYESSFFAPEAKILIVDDNEMNLEVERRLLEDTDMTIDKAISGRDALEQCQKVRYDAIFMDHLMPGMDGIECLDQLRNQTGGLNRTTPVIVLTANAGSENRDLYRRSGFDGYLVKPVSGEAMEEMLIRHISSEKVVLKSVMRGDNEEIHTRDKYAEKLPVIITSSSMCDLPDAVIKKLHIPIIPFMIETEDGTYKDGVQIDANELVRHLTKGRQAISFPPDESEFTEFFAEELKKAHHLIHISITTSMSDEFRAASEAAKAFDNVTVINSGCLSSSTGILVLIAQKLAQQGMPVEEIVSELETVKQRLKCSFVINTTEYMAKKGLVSLRLHRIAKALNLHPALRIKNDKAGLGGLWIGRTKNVYRNYINRALPPDTIPDPDVVFITYADIPTDMLAWIEQEIKKAAYFERVVFKQTSAAISSNCGPGSFGILYFMKSNKAYNIASYFDSDAATADLPMESVTASEDEDAEEIMDETAEEIIEETAGKEETPGEAEKSSWLKDLDCIDTAAAVKNSGSEEAFRAVLKIFYDSINDKHDELEDAYASEDWEKYTIKIHALKSSARLVGALELGKAAELLEMAGKENDVQYIRDNHEAVMADHMKFREALAPVFEAEAAGDDEDDGRPVADDFIMESIYEEIKDAAEKMDCDRVEAIMQEIGEYSIPGPEKERFAAIREKADMLDYDGILEALDRS